MAYIGNQSNQSIYAPQVAFFNGNGSATTFTLPLAVVSSQVTVVVANVIQNPNTAYSITGTTLTFTSAPPTGTNNIWVKYDTLQTNTIQPSPGTVGNAAFGSVTAIPFASGQSLGAGDSSLMKNRIINGAMVIDQRNAGASVTPADSQYLVDRFVYFSSQASKFTAQQVVSAPVGFVNSLKFTTASAVSIGSSDYFMFNQKIEGYNCADLGWGTANAKTVTLSFWVYSSLTGTFGGSITNESINRSYPFSYSVSSANTWTQISITIAGDTSGTWPTNNQSCIRIMWGLGVGSAYSGTAGSWTGTAYFSATGATSVVGTNGATFYITGVQLEVGSSATGYEYRQYQQELALCQRYHQGGGSTATSIQNAGYNIVQFFSNISYPSGQTIRITLPMKCSMRATPTAVYADGNNNLGKAYFNGANATISLFAGTPEAISVLATAVSTGTLDFNLFYALDSEL